MTLVGDKNLLLVLAANVRELHLRKTELADETKED
jgi:hypothetical protein